MDAARGLDVLKIFAARAGAKLERMKAEAELREALAEVERLKNQLHAENVYLQEEILRDNHFEEIIGTSPALLAVLQQLERVAPTDATVLKPAPAKSCWRAPFITSARAANVRSSKSIAEPSVPDWLRANFSVTSKAHSPARSTSV